MLCKKINNKENSIHNIIDSIIFFSTIFFLVSIVIESIWNIWEHYNIVFFIIDFIISTIFTIEYFLYFSCSKHKRQFILNFWRIIDLLSFAPFFILLLVGFFITHLQWNFSLIIDILIILKLFRIFKILRLLDKIPLTNWFLHSLKEYKEEYKAVFILFFTILYILSFAVYYFEHNTNPQINNMLDALWWWLVTMTTVGYGDIVPVTPIWKAIASLLIFTWPLVLWLVSAITIMVFMDNTERHRYIIFSKLSKRVKFCPKCNAKNLKEANYCMKCWFHITKDDI